MVAHTLEELGRAGLPPESIKYEHFYYAAASGHRAEAALTRSGDHE
jgi:hypothetical protein